MEIERVLEKIGLSSNEIKIYLTLIDWGSLKAGKIAKLAKIDRSSCYNSLKSLIEKGVVSYVLIGKIKWFQASNPDKLLMYVKEQEEDLKVILPQLKQRNKHLKTEGQVRVFKGIKGVKSLFMEIIKTGEDNYVFGSEGQFSKIMPEFALQFDRMKQEKNIKTKMIIREKRMELDNKTTEYRFFPDVVNSPAVTNIFGDKIIILIWTDEPEGILIENEASARAYKSYFDFMWNNAIK
ncbi:MAG: hypothetical protein KC589_07045 [Nanoarchaeota archaeon]|nr:hypothetical protein [Nanoarchaeota archaeon]